MKIRVEFGPNEKSFGWLMAGIAKSRTVWLALVGFAFDNVPEVHRLTDMYIKPPWKTVISGVIVAMIIYFRSHPKQLLEAQQAEAQAKADLAPIIKGVRETLPTAGLSAEQEKKAETVLAAAEKAVEPKPTVNP